MVKPFSCVSLVESVSRESDEIRLFPSHQRERETTRYSPVNNEKNRMRHHVNRHSQIVLGNFLATFWFGSNFFASEQL